MARKALHERLGGSTRDVFAVSCRPRAFGIALGVRMELLSYLWIGLAVLAALVASLDQKRRVTFGAIALGAGILGAALVRFGTTAWFIGGARLTYEIDVAAVPAGQLPPDAVVRTGIVVTRRLESLGLPRAEVKTHEHAVVVEVAASDEKLDEVKRTLAVWGRLTFQMVDDDEDFFEQYATSNQVPQSIRFERENAPLGLGKTKPVYYAFLPVKDGEPMKDALVRLRAWTDTLPVPKDHEISFEKIVRHDPDTDKWEDEGWRTFFLRKDADITGTMIMAAHARPDSASSGFGGWLVQLEFTEEGAQRFEDVTARNVKRRFAIVVDGVVSSAPVIQTRIAGGTGVITMGAGSIDEQAKNATALAVVLRSGDLPAPLILVSEDRIAGLLGTKGVLVLWGVAFAGAIALLGFMAQSAVRGGPRRAAGSP